MSYQSHDPAQRAQLATEINLPAYEAERTSGSDQGIADKLNAPAGLTVPRGIRSASEVMGAITGSEFVALVAGARDYLIALVSAGEVDLSNSVIRANLQAAFPAGTASRAALIALADKATGSRAEQLFGIGTVISASDISQARG
jgi:hypothetical protein